jgi:hypothetical protein
VGKPEGLGFGGGSKLGTQFPFSFGGKKIKIEKKKYIKY